MASFKTTRTLSLKKIVGKVPTQVIKVTDPDDPTKQIDKSVAIEQNLALMIGRADDFDTGSTDYGEFTKFIGTFEGTNLLTGDKTMSGKCIFPAVAEDLARSVFLEAKRADPTASVNLAFVVAVKPDLRSSVGYEFAVTVIDQGSGRADPLEALRASIGTELSTLLPPDVISKTGLLPAPSSDVAAIADQSSLKTKADKSADKADA